MKLGKLFFCVWGMTFVLAGNAHAYIDPGTGGLVWQMLVAGFVGLFFYVRKTRNWIVGVIKKVISRVKEDDGR